MKSTDLKIKYLLFIFTSLFVVGISYYSLKKGLTVRNIQLELKEDPAWEGSMEEVQFLLESKLQIFIGKKMEQVSLNELLRITRSESRIGTVQILRRLPNSFFIQVQFRKPLLVLLDPTNGKIHPLSPDGQLLSFLPFSRIPNLPILRGIIFVKDINIRKQAIRFLSLMPEQGEFSRQNISEIKYSDKESSLIFILSKNGKPIKVGYDPARMKTKRIESVLRYLSQKNIKWRVIDAQFPQKIVVSTRKAI